MPKRFLKPGITTSENWNSCEFETQSFYIRIITLVDDYGRYDGRPQILKAHAFPLSEKVTVSKIEKMCLELVKNGLATFYKKGDKIVLQLLRWEERLRSPSKFPQFDDTCEQMFADVSKCSPPPSSSSTTTTSPAPACAGGEEGLEFPQNLRTPEFKAAWEKWVPFRKKMRGCRDWVTLFQGQLDWLGTFPERTAIAILDQSIRHGWQGLFEIKQGQSKPVKSAHVVGGGNI